MEELPITIQYRNIKWYLTTHGGVLNNKKNMKYNYTIQMEVPVPKVSEGMNLQKINSPN